MSTRPENTLWDVAQLNAAKPTDAQPFSGSHGNQRTEDQALRSAAIRLASSTADPLLKKALLRELTAGDKTAAPRYRDYVRRYKGQGQPMGKEEWEAKVFGKPKGESKKAPAKNEKKAPAKGKWAPKVQAVMKKNDLLDDDAEEVKKHKKALFDPNAKSRMTDAQRFRLFLSKAKPETKERMKGMSVKDFMEILGAILDDEEGGE